MKWCNTQQIQILMNWKNNCITYIIFDMNSIVSILNGIYTMQSHFQIIFCISNNFLCSLYPSNLKAYPFLTLLIIINVLTFNSFTIFFTLPFHHVVFMKINIFLFSYIIMFYFCQC